MINENHFQQVKVMDIATVRVLLHYAMVIACVLTVASLLLQAPTYVWVTCAVACVVCTIASFIANNKR